MVLKNSSVLSFFKIIFTVFWSWYGVFYKGKTFEVLYMPMEVVWIIFQQWNTRVEVYPNQGSFVMK